MPRLNYREVAHRFTHIDADFVGCEVGFPNRESYYTVSLYPYWEHPLYIQAIKAGARWGFSSSHEKEAYQNITVYPIGIHQFSIGQTGDVYDWQFTRENPMLWQFEETSQVLCNDPLSLTQWMDIAALLIKAFKHRVTFAELSKYASLEMIHRWGATGSFVLGTFPRTLFIPLTRILDERSISYSSWRVPDLIELPVLFCADGDYIIADDFEIDVPEFVHKPEWFEPGN